MAKDSSPSVQISVRVDRQVLAELERLGGQAQPLALNRNQMVGVAIRDYVDRNGKKKGAGRKAEG